MSALKLGELWAIPIMLRVSLLEGLSALTAPLGRRQRARLEADNWAETLVRAAQTDFAVSIFRPGMIVGDSRTGAIQTFNTIYVPLRMYLTGKLPLVPTSPSLRLNIVPVDYVADCIARLSFDARARGLTFHLVGPTTSLRPSYLSSARC